jgi:hypothetical protein
MTLVLMNHTAEIVAIQTGLNPEIFPKSPPRWANHSYQAFLRQILAAAYLSTSSSNELQDLLLQIKITTRGRVFLRRT